MHRKMRFPTFGNTYGLESAPTIPPSRTMFTQYYLLRIKYTRVINILSGGIGLSAALFAPGWVHEVIPEEDISKPYEVRQQEFWDRIDSCCSSSLATKRRHSLPFHSDFNPGCRSPRKVLLAPRPDFISNFCDISRASVVKTRYQALRFNYSYTVSPQ